MVNSIIMFTMLTVGTAMLAYLAFVGRLRSRAVLILMPAATLGICVLTLLAEADDPLLPVVAIVMAGAAVVMVLAASVLLVSNSRRVRPGSDDRRHVHPPDGEGR